MNRSTSPPAPPQQAQQAGPSRPRRPPTTPRADSTLPRLASVSLLLFLLAAGCPSKPTGDNQLPNLRELRSRIPMDLPPTEFGRGPTVRLRIARFDLPAKADLTKAWDVARTSGIEPAMAPAWRDNGIRAAVINEILLDDFLKLVPTAELAHLLRMTASDIPTPIETRFAFKRPLQIDLNLPGLPTQTTMLRPGQCRFLIEAQPEPDGSSLIFVTPQHYYPQASIVPRPLTEKQLDGRVFQELSLQARLAPRQALIVGLYRVAPPPPPADPPPQTSEEPVDPAAAEPAATQPAAEEEPPPPPMNLGRLTLEASRFARPIQLLFVIMLDEQ